MAHLRVRVNAGALAELDLNRSLLARQHLLRRTKRSLPDVLEDMGGLQMQYAPSGYIGLWTRMSRFARDDLTRALERREVIQATMMRGTIHLVAAADYWPLTYAIRRHRREWFERVGRRQINALDMAAVADAAREELAGGPLRMRELIERVGRRGHPAQAVKWVGNYLDLVRVPPSGTWEQRRADLYGLAEDWLPPPVGLSEDAGSVLVVQRYLGAFGPAAVADIAAWAGVPAAALAPALDALNLRHYTDEQGKPLVDLAETSDDSLPPPDTPPPARFLPTWDATLLVHARRTQILAERHRPLVFSTKTPQSVPTFLISGQVAGTWRYADGRVQTEAFEPLSRAARAGLEAEAERLAAFHAA